MRVKLVVMQYVHMSISPSFFPLSTQARYRTLMVDSQNCVPPISEYPSGPMSQSAHISNLSCLPPFAGHNQHNGTLQREVLTYLSVQLAARTQYSQTPLDWVRQATSLRMRVGMATQASLGFCLSADPTTVCERRIQPGKTPIPTSTASLCSSEATLLRKMTEPQPARGQRRSWALRARPDFSSTTEASAMPPFISDSNCPIGRGFLDEACSASRICC